MRFEAENLDRAGLLELLRLRYRLDVDTLTFVPYGIDSWSYVAACRDGSRAFVKLSLRGPEAAAKASTTPLLAALSARSIPVPCPIPDRDGGFVSTYAAYDVTVQEFLDGRNLERETAWPDDVYGRLAEIVAAVHASTGAVRSLVERSEDYGLAFLPDLAAALADIESGVASRAGDPTLAELAAVMRPRVDELRTWIARLERLREVASARPWDEVLCHTDIWGSNLLLADDGSLHLLDWDGARIGPAEQDLFMFAGTTFFPADRFAWFLDRYERAFRRVPLDADRFGFYLYRRNLEDLAWFVAAIAAGRTDVMSPDRMVAIAASQFDEMAEIEGQIGRVRKVLAARG